MKILRVFPRRTNATPIDENVRIGYPDIFDYCNECDLVKISVTFKEDIPIAEKLQFEYERIAPKVLMGGVALGDPGGVFKAGEFLKKGYTITSRGCPNKCWFCDAWRREGNKIRELPIEDGYNILDNNLLACSEKHIKSVFKMLKKQKKPAEFTGGFEAKILKDWHIDELLKIRLKSVFFAYDTKDDYEPLIVASKKLKEAGLLKNHKVGCYVLIGYKNDTIEKAKKRLINVIKLGLFPQAMLFENNDKIWKRFQREWANKVIVGTKMREFKVK